MPYCCTHTKRVRISHAFCAADFVDTARPPTPYSSKDSECHTNTTVHSLHISLTLLYSSLLFKPSYAMAWFLCLHAFLAHLKPSTAVVVHLCELCTLAFCSALHCSLDRKVSLHFSTTMCICALRQRCSFNTLSTQQRASGQRCSSVITTLQCCHLGFPEINQMSLKKKQNKRI